MTATGPPALALRGGPLIMLLALLAVWAMLRAAWWENPFATPAAALGGPPPAALAPRSLAAPELLSGAIFPDVAYDPAAAGLPVQVSGGAVAGAPRAGPPSRPRRLVTYAPAPALYLPGISPYPSLPPGSPRAAASPAALAADAAQEQPPFFAAAQRPPDPATAKPDRWSLDIWSFYRQGSEAGVPVPQGRAPIYGASQMGAVLQYRLAMLGGHAPRLYLRGYRALIAGGESELAFGASLRPLPKVPVRVAAEARYTVPEVGDPELRPAAYAVTELAPVPLPLGTRLEAYAQGGWVGGRTSTYFADGQASITREIGLVGRMSRDAVRLSLGAGAWGGAQKDAQRLDMGPTARVDFRLGRVPARLSVDWRQRVAGDAAPGSGVAATLSAGF